MEATYLYILSFRQSIKKSLIQGFTVALMRAMISFVFAAGWRLAAFLVTNGRIGILEVFR